MNMKSMRLFFNLIVKTTNQENYNLVFYAIWHVTIFTIYTYITLFNKNNNNNKKIQSAGT